MNCEGSCEKHVGEVIKVLVHGHNIPEDKPYPFDYCEEAIAEDKRRGFTVTRKEPLPAPPLPDTAPIEPRQGGK